MLLAFGFGVLLVIVSGFWALWHHGAKKNKAVLLLANGLPTARLGFSLLSTGECQRLWQDKNCQFYFLSSSGVFYRLNSKNGKDWERLLVL